MGSSRRRLRIGDIWDEVLYQIDKRFPPDRRVVGAVLGVLVLVTVGWFTWQALSVRSALNEASDQAEVLRDQIVQGDVDRAKATLRQVQENAADARRTSDGVLWRGAAKIPWVGRNVEAVQVVSTEMEAVAKKAMPPLVELADQLNAMAFSPQGGRIDVKAIEKAAPAIAEASAAFNTSKKALDAIDPSTLFAPLRGPIGSVDQSIDAATSVAANVDLAARMLPGLLGGDGTRRYLLLAQNTAEARPTGGIIGTYAVIRARNGKIDLTDVGPNSDFRPITQPVVKMTKEERSVFPSTMASDIRDINTTPDFPRTASIAKKMFERDFGTKVDGVVTVDPVVLSYLLAGIGPVQVGNQAILDQNSVVPALLHQVYVIFEDRALQDAFFEKSLETIFDRFTGGGGDPALTLAAIIRSVDENRIAFWSARKSEQEIIAPTALSGDWTDDQAQPRIGMLFSDAASTKMHYFLRTSTSARSQSCLKDDRQVIYLSTEFSSSAPTKGLPVNVTGDGKYVKKGRMRLNVRLISPTGGHFTSVKVNGEPVTVYADQWQGRNVTRLEIQLKPGESKVVTANATTAKGQTGDPIVTLTPGMASQRNDFSVLSACAD